MIQRFWNDLALVCDLLKFRTVEVKRRVTSNECAWISCSFLHVCRSSRLNHSLAADRYLLAQLSRGLWTYSLSWKSRLWRTCTGVSMTPHTCVYTWTVRIAQCHKNAALIIKRAKAFDGVHMGFKRCLTHFQIRRQLTKPYTHLMIAPPKCRTNLNYFEKSTTMKNVQAHTLNRGCGCYKLAYCLFYCVQDDWQTTD